MWDDELKKHLNSHTDLLLNHFQESRDKYVAIWDYYNKHLPTCIAECSEARKGYGEEPDRDGPQGIYWIGKEPKVFFVGRDHYGWYGEATWPNDINSICYSPLQFSYYTVESMGSYWGILKDLIESIFKGHDYSWDEKLQKVSFSNACKCLSDNRTYQWNMHDNCLKHKYVANEIITVNARVNVLFTKSYQLIDKLFDSQTEMLYDRDEFTARKHGSQVIIECDHPGRKSHEWREKLKQAIKDSM